MDAVIAWVDGNDPVHKAKRARYATDAQASNDRIAGSTRFTSIGEVHYCVESLRRMAPFLRKIFIITDGQDPGVKPGNIPVEIVDHKVIFRGYEQFLPVFNSLAIETVLWRIPDLDEEFIYLNDDIFLCKPVSVEDFFDSGRMVCYCTNYSMPFLNMVRWYNRHWRTKALTGYKYLQMNTAEYLGEKWVIPLIGHTAAALKKSFCEKVFNEYKDLMLKNMSFRFREPSQFVPHQFFHMAGLKEGKTVTRPRSGKALYLEPKDGRDYIAGKLRSFDRRDEAVFCCFNSMDKASQEDIDLAFGWLKARLSK